MTDRDPVSVGEPCPCCGKVFNLAECLYLVGGDSTYCAVHHAWHPRVPQDDPPDRTMTEAELDRADYIERHGGDAPPQPDPQGGETDGGSLECPICGFYFTGGECVGCGYVARDCDQIAPQAISGQSVAISPPLPPPVSAEPECPSCKLLLTPWRGLGCIGCGYKEGIAASRAEGEPPRASQGSAHSAASRGDQGACATRATTGITT